MTESESQDEATREPEALHFERKIRNEGRSLWQLLPRKTLSKAALLVALLLCVFWFQKNAQSCATTFTEGLVPATPPPARSGAQPPDEGRTVRLAPIKLPAPKATDSTSRTAP